MKNKLKKGIKKRGAALIDLPTELTNQISSFLNTKDNVNLYSTSKGLNKEFENDKCYILLQKLIKEKHYIPKDICKKIPKNEIVPFFEQYTEYKIKSLTLEDIVKKNYLLLFKYLINNEVHITQYMVTHKTRVFSSSKRSLLLHCIINNRIEFLKFLLETRLFSFVYQANGGYLFNSIRNGNYDITKLLIEKGVDTDLNTALLYSVDYNSIDIVKLLISKGADIHFRNDYALKTALRKNNKDITEFLLKNGANKEVFEQYKENERQKKISKLLTTALIATSVGLTSHKIHKFVKNYKDKIKKAKQDRKLKKQKIKKAKKFTTNKSS